jgi:hypothetical protein
MDKPAKRPSEPTTFDRNRDDEGDWDVSTDVSPPAAGCAPRSAPTGAKT